MTDGGLRARVIAAARSCGADAVRIAPAEPQAWTHERLAASFARGDLADVALRCALCRGGRRPAYALARGAQRRLRRRGVCHARRTAAPRPRARIELRLVERLPPPHARAARVRWRGELESLGATTAIACDTAPVAERAFAERAGVGWIGKHTNLIAPGLGSYVFLGEVVTSLALAARSPAAEELRQLHALRRRMSDRRAARRLHDRCVVAASPISPSAPARSRAQLRPLIGTWVWGCDLCQEACPPTQPVAAHRRGLRAARRADARAVAGRAAAPEQRRVQTPLCAHGDRLARRGDPAPQRRRGDGQPARPGRRSGAGRSAAGRSASAGARPRGLGAGPHRLAAGASGAARPRRPRDRRVGRR